MKGLLLGLLLLSVSIAVDAQSRWKKYDSIYFENLFLPNFSNLLMPKGYVEALLSNSLLTANRGWSNSTGSTFGLNGRYTYNYVTAIGNAGVSKNNRFNAGLELHYAIGYHDSDPGSSWSTIFNGSPPGFVQRARAVTSAGPRIKWRPFKHNLHFVYISTLQFPLIHNAAVESMLGQQRAYWGNQFLYSFALGKKLVFFAQDDLYVYFGEANAHNQYFNSLTFYGYFLITRHLFPFVSAGYGTSYATNTISFQNQFQYLPVGAGLQYQYSLRFTLNAYYNQYAWAQNYSDWRTLSVGFRGVF
jgi:hypothetical protein